MLANNLLKTGNKVIEFNLQNTFEDYKEKALKWVNDNKKFYNFTFIFKDNKKFFKKEVININLNEAYYIFNVQVKTSSIIIKQGKNQFKFYTDSLIKIEVYNK